MSDELYIPGPKDYWIEIVNDDTSHGIVIARFDRWQKAAELYDELVKDRPQMRVVMRHISHVYRNYIPARLHNSYDRSREYPTGP